MKPLPSLETLQAAFRLDAESPSGLVWAVSVSKKSLSGSPAGNESTKGYYRVRLGGQAYACHRIVWSLANGRLITPDLQIDHIDGNRRNNDPSNLRTCTTSENLQNIVVKARSTSGLVGVHPVGSRWHARIYVRGQQFNLGVHDSMQAAHEAYLDAKRRLHTFNPVPRDLTGDQR